MVCTHDLNCAYYKHPYSLVLTTSCLHCCKEIWQELGPYGMH